MRAGATSPMSRLGHAKSKQPEVIDLADDSTSSSSSSHSSLASDDEDDWQEEEVSRARSPPRKRLKRLVPSAQPAAAKAQAGRGNGWNGGGGALRGAGPPAASQQPASKPPAAASKQRAHQQQVLPFADIGKGGGKRKGAATATAASPSAAAAVPVSARPGGVRMRQPLILKPGPGSQGGAGTSAAQLCSGGWGDGPAEGAHGGSSQPGGSRSQQQQDEDASQRSCELSPAQQQQHGSGSQPLKQLVLVPTQQPVHLAQRDMAHALSRGCAPAATSAPTAAAAAARSLWHQRPAGSHPASAPQPQPSAISADRRAQAHGKAGAAAPAPAAAAASAALSELWYEKYAPSGEEDLAVVVHRKKLSEVKDWLAAQLHDQQSRWQRVTGGGGGRRQGCSQAAGCAAQPPRSCMAILSGPPGCGKSSCVRVLAEQLGYQVVEWTPPAPTLWSETQYQSSALGWQPYVSKLEDFEAFVSRAKFPVLILTSTAPTSRLHPHQHQLQTQLPTQPGETHQRAAASQALAQAQAPRPKLLLLDDLPHASDPERRKRLASSLQELAMCARCPIAVIATESEGSSAGSGGGGGRSGFGGEVLGAKGLHKDVLAALQSAGAISIAFNPITANNIAKLMLLVAKKESVELAPTVALGLAEAADGDVRNALQSLQMAAALQRATLTGNERRELAPQKRGRGKRAAAGSDKPAATGGATSLRGCRQQKLSSGEVARLAAAQRDLGLSLFHALGKLLYNKRDDANDGDEDEEGAEGGAPGAGRRPAATGGSKSKSNGKDSAVVVQLREHALHSSKEWTVQCQGAHLQERYQRPPMRYDPEAIVQRSGLEAPPLVAFLHENWPHFLEGEGAEDDAADLAAYLSDAALLCGGSRGSALASTSSNVSSSLWWEDVPGAANIGHAAAASVAARGMLYGNTHPAPRRWLPLRAPTCAAIDTARIGNQGHVRTCAARLAVNAHGCVGGLRGCAPDLAANVLPWLRLLPASPAYHGVLPLLPSAWNYYWNGAVSEGAFLRYQPPAAMPVRPQQPGPQWRGQQPAPGGGDDGGGDSGGGDSAVDELIGRLEEDWIEDDDD